MSNKQINFRCPDCGEIYRGFNRCKINTVYCSKKWHKEPLKMVRVNGFCCEMRPDLDGKKCDYCGCCDTGTDADFDTYAVQVQNGEGYYDEAGRYHSYHIYDD